LVGCSIKYNTYLISKTFIVLAHNRCNYNQINNQFIRLINLFEFNTRNSNISKFISINSIKLHTNLRNHKYIIVRSGMAFKKRGKEPYNNLRRFIRFTVNYTIRIRDDSNISLVSIMRILENITPRFRLFGGEVRAYAIGVCMPVELMRVCTTVNTNSIATDTMYCDTYNTPHSSIL